MAMQLTPNVRALLGLDDYDPRDADSGPREALPTSTYNDPDTLNQQPLPPQEPSYQDPTTLDQTPVKYPSNSAPEPTYTIQDGRTTPPTPGGNWQPVQTVQPYDPRTADEGQRETGPAPWTPLSDVPQQTTPAAPYSPYGAPRDATAGIDGSYAPDYGDGGRARQQAQNPVTSAESPVQAYPGEPDYVDRRSPMTRALNTPITVPASAKPQPRVQLPPDYYDQTGLDPQSAPKPKSRLQSDTEAIPYQAAEALRTSVLDIINNVEDTGAAWGEHRKAAALGNAVLGIANTFGLPFNVLARTVNDMFPEATIAGVGVGDALTFYHDAFNLGAGAVNVGRKIASGQPIPLIERGIAAAGRAQEAVDDAGAAAGRGVRDLGAAGRALPEGEMQLGSGFVPEGGTTPRETWRSRVSQDLGARPREEPITEPYIDSTGRQVTKPGMAEWRVERGANGVPEMVQTRRNFFNNAEEIPGTRQPLDSVYRVISKEDYDQALQRGYLQSDGRLNLSEGEGTVASAFEPSVFYSPKNGDAVAVRIRVDPQDGWRLDNDGYIKTNNPIPVDRIESTLGYSTNQYGNPTRYVDAPQRAGSGYVPTMSDARNAAQGAFVGAASPDLTDPDAELTPQERLARAGMGAVMGVAAGRGLRNGRGAAAERRLGSGFVADSGPTPRTRMNMDDIAQRAEEVLGVKPEEVRRWQQETLNEPAYTRAVRGSALQQAANIDEDAAMRAISRLEAAQSTARGAENLGDLERLDVADAALEAAQAAQAMRTSRAASTAEGRATARALAQRRQAIVARQGVVSAERAKAVGQDAAFAAQAVRRIERSGQLSAKDEQLLRTLQDKLREAEKHGLMDDGVGGKLDALEQPASTSQKPPAWTTLVTEAAERRATPGMRSEASRYEPGWGTVAAQEIGSQLVPGAVGAAAGAAANPDDPQSGAAAGFAAGATLGFGARRLQQRFPSKAGTFGTFGFSPFSPTAEHPTRSVAMGVDPNTRYTFQYRVVDLNDLIASHGPNGNPNPSFPQELQPRVRERAASRVQVDSIAQRFNPDAYLWDAGRIDSGPMIIGPDRVVESGNGRTMALRQVAEQNPEKYQEYVDSLKGHLGDYGLDESALAGKQQPVLVRERLSDVDRAAFAAEANGGTVADMSPIEQAMQDASKLTDDSVARLAVKGDQTIDEALLDPENGAFIRAFMQGVPENARGKLLDASGDLNTAGLARAKSALLVRTYQGSAGNRLATAFVESTDPGIRNVQHGLYASLPSVARAEALIAAGERDAGLSFADDVARAADVYSRLRRAGISVGDYVAQAGMFKGRETTPLQDKLLRYMADNARSPRMIRALLDDYAKAVVDAVPAGADDMFGGAVATASKEELFDGILRRLGADPSANVGGAGASRAVVEGAGSRQITVPEPGAGAQAGRGAGGATLADDLAATGSLTPEQQIARLQAENDRLRAQGSVRRVRQPRERHQAPTPLAPAAPRAPMDAPSGGPEGTLAVQGAPARVQTPRLGPIEPIAPRGGPEGRLMREGAPPEPANLPAPERLPATGGPEDTLRAPGTPEPLVRPTSAAPMDAPRGGPEGTLQRSLTDQQRADDRMLEQSRIRGVVQQIDDVLSNPGADGAAERLQNLYADLTEISQAGFTRSSEIKKRLQRNGLLRAGLASRTEDVTGLVEAIARTDPSKPEELRAVLQIISKPRLIDKILEYQYVNMLSSPITQARNISANVWQLTGRLLLQNPLEFAYSGGTSTGVGSAFKGAGRGFMEGLGEAGQIMRTGVSSKNMERAADLGDYGQINREYLTEQFGKVGVLAHVISTRPLAAMDALLGHAAYASAAEQYAQRTADKLLKNGSATVAGMSREQARAHVMSNIWDYPEIIEQAGKISDYTLLKGRGNNRIEQGLRQIFSSHVAEDAGFTRQAGAFLANQVVPFMGVPINFAKQGAERSVGVPVNAVRAAGAYRAGDVERGAELAAKATIGAAALIAGTVLALGDNLTSDGPTDGAQREVWLRDHKPNSYRIPGTQTWYSWEGTPFAIPFAMIAGAKENAGESLANAAKKGQADPVDLGLSAVGGLGRGAIQGFASQSFVKSLGQQYELLTGNQTGLGTVAASAAGTASRFVPASSMLNFLARVSDTMERDPGKPQTASEVPQNILDRMSTRVPGARQTVDTKLGIYGEDVPNDQGGAAGLINAIPIPGIAEYRGKGGQSGDPITRRLEEAGQGISGPPSTISVPNVTGSQIVMTPREQRIYQQVAGQSRRKKLEAVMNTGRYDRLAPAARQKMLDDIESDAREEAAARVRATIGPAELRRRDVATQKR